MDCAARYLHIYLGTYAARNTYVHYLFNNYLPSGVPSGRDALPNTPAGRRIVSFVVYSSFFFF